ncbi:MAG: hypothetical protein R3C01_12290 [Planctomycetaceae bacterium]
MSDTSKNMIYGSMAAAGVVAVAAVLDLVTGIPFGWGSGATTVMDILFLVSAAIVGYLAWDALQDLRK